MQLSPLSYGTLRSKPTYTLFRNTKESHAFEVVTITLRFETFLALAKIAARYIYWPFYSTYLYVCSLEHSNIGKRGLGLCATSLGQFPTILVFWAYIYTNFRRHRLASRTQCKVIFFEVLLQVDIQFPIYGQPHLLSITSTTASHNLTLINLTSSERIEKCYAAFGWDYLRTFFNRY
jgi:hypothetical protein